MRTGSNETVSSHFLGSVVYVEKGLYTVSLRPSLLVIDGQQRLTTMSRLLEALARRVGNTEPLDGFSAVKIRNHYLQNSLESETVGISSFCQKLIEIASYLFLRST